MFSSQIMSVFGSEFTSGWLVLVVLSAVHLIGYSAGGALVGHVLQMSGKQDIELINSAVMVTLNIVLNFLLIPIYGILGAAIATGVSYAVINVARIVEVYILLRVHAYDTNYHKPFVAGFAVVLFTMFLSMLGISRQYWVVQVAVLSIVYFVVIYFLGLEQEDKMIWEAIKKRINK
jgi:O-antigen/teichoic acid export membrane protein